MKIKSIEHYKELQRERQKLLDDAQRRKAIRHMRKMAHEAKLAKERAEREFEPTQLVIQGTDEELKALAQDMIKQAVDKLRNP